MDKRPDLANDLRANTHYWLAGATQKEWEEGCRELFKLEPELKGANLCKAMALGDGSARVLIRNFEKFDFENATGSERMELCHILAGNVDTAEEFVKNIDKFKLEKATTEERMEICKKAIGVSPRAAAVLPKET